MCTQRAAAFSKCLASYQFLRSGKSVFVVLDSQISFTMATVNTSNPSVPRINFLPQPTVLRPFSGQDHQLFFLSWPLATVSNFLQASDVV